MKILAISFVISAYFDVLLASEKSRHVDRSVVVRLFKS